MIGMSRLIDFVDERHGGGSLSGAAIGYGCLVALGPLLSACGDAQTFNNGWLMGTRIRAFLTHTLRERLAEFAVPIAIVVLAVVILSVVVLAIVVLAIVVLAIFWGGPRVGALLAASYWGDWWHWAYHRRMAR